MWHLTPHTYAVLRRKARAQPPRASPPPTRLTEHTSSTSQGCQSQWTKVQLLLFEESRGKGGCTHEGVQNRSGIMAPFHRDSPEGAGHGAGSNEGCVATAALSRLCVPHIQSPKKNIQIHLNLQTNQNRSVLQWPANSESPLGQESTSQIGVYIEKTNFISGFPAETIQPNWSIELA